MKFDILNRWTGSVQFTAEIECAEDAPGSIKVGLAVKLARLRGADLSGTVLRDADLSGAVLRDADLSGAVLRDADLSGAKVIFAGVDARSYEFYLTAGAAPNDIVIRAGCRRWVTFTEARAHFTQGYASNGNVLEILAKIDLLESVAKSRGYVTAEAAALAKAGV